MRRRPASWLVASFVRATAVATVLATGAAALATNDRAAASATEPSRRQRELDDLRRQDLARDLEARGVTVRWQEHPLAELLDWRDRIDASRALAADFGVRVDWRAQSAAALMDMRLRAAKAAELRATFGLVVDWRRYGWLQLERLRSSLAAATSNPSRGAKAGAQPTVSGDALYRDALAPFEPNRKVRRPRRNFRDRDAIIEPLFASSGPRPAAMRLASLHPDGILEPSFSRPSPRPSDRGADALVTPRL